MPATFSIKNISKEIKMRFVPIFIFLFAFIIPLAAQTEKNLDNRYQLALSYEQAGQLAKAESIYRELYSLQPLNYLFFESLNKNLISQKKYENSIELINQKIVQTPQDVNLYGLLGSTYYISDRTEKANEAWEKGISLNPTNLLNYRVIANYTIENRAYDKAAEILNRGKKFSGDPSIFSMELGSIYSVNMKYADAANEYCSLLVYHPEQLQNVKARVAGILKGPGAQEQLIRSVKDFTRSAAKFEIYDLLTFLYQASGNYKSAFENVNVIEEKFTGNGTYVYLFSQEAFRNGEYEWAAEGYRYLINHYPNSSYALSARLGTARSLELTLDQKFTKSIETWKPYYKPVPLFKDEYQKIIDAYSQFIKENSGNALCNEAYFRIAEIFKDRIYDTQKADSVYKIIIGLPQAGGYSARSLIARGIISIKENNLDSAQKIFDSVLRSMRLEESETAAANFYSAKIEFWKGSFSKALKFLAPVANNYSTDYANDALELEAFINSAMKDSLNLYLFAQADLRAIQNKHKEAGIEFKTLSDNPNLFIINDFAKIKFAEMLIAENDLAQAINVLEEFTDSKKDAIFADKCVFLLAECYQYGTKDLLKAVKTYQKLLETFPNSLYFDRAREALQLLPTNNG